MSYLDNLFRWFSGGSDPYMTLAHCMRGDVFWIGLTVVLDLLVALGYVFIARHWWENEKLLPSSQAKLALGNMKRIFLVCGTCGYLFIPIKLFWPAWRLYDGFMIVLVFVTWRYALNARQLRVVYHELVRNNQLSVELEESRAESKRKSFFLNAISHDLRTPLNGLMLQAELASLSVKTHDLESLSESLAEIKACARSTADLLGSFLELGRLDWIDDPNRQSSFPLDELTSSVINGFRPIADSKGLILSSETSAAHFCLLTDRVKLTRILQNLVGNGVKFTDQGRVDLTVQTSGRDLVFQVSDTGTGIPETQFETIFDEFYQVNNSERDRTKGFGLGLSIARRLARQLGGDLVVQSEFGRGSRFIVNLPGVIESVKAGSGADSGTGPTLRANQSQPSSATLG